MAGKKGMKQYGSTIIEEVLAMREAGKTNKEIIKSTFDTISKELPYKKTIGYCRDRKNLSEYHNFFVKEFPNLKTYWTCTTATTNDFNAPNGEDDEKNLDDFYESKGNSILLCVNRCKEGSDIQYCDSGILLDAVKKRSVLVGMQITGRIARPDKDGKKTHAIIIDTFIRDDTHTEETITVNKIINYFEKLVNISSIESFTQNDKNLYEKLKKIKTECDEKQNEITVKIDDNKKHDSKLKFEYLTKSVDWNKVKQQLNEKIDNQFGITKDDKFNVIINKLKELNVFNKKCKFSETYDKLQLKIKQDNDFPIDLYNEYKENFDTNTWYGLLGYDTITYLNYDEMKKLLWKNKYYKNIFIKEYDKLRNNNNKLPFDPTEFYKTKIKEKDGMYIYDEV